MKVETIFHEGKTVGFIAADSEIAGRSCGGLRMMADVTAEELSVLARAMTLKYGLLGLPQGGGKAGVIGDPEGDPEAAGLALDAFGRGAAEILRSRRFVLGTDMGTTAASIRRVLAAAGTAPGKRELRGVNSGYYTALGVAMAARAMAGHLGETLRGKTALIEGFGSVGRALAGILEKEGVSIIGTSTSQGATCRGESMPRADLLHQPADLLLPCARHHSLHAENADRIQVRMIVPGANAPVSPDAQRILDSRGIAIMPDFVANCGGVLGGTMEFAGIGQSDIERFFRSVLADRFAQLLRGARGGPLREYCEQLALAQFSKVKQAAERRTLRGSIFGAGLAMYRHGWLPPALVGSASRGYFRSRISGEW